MRNESASKKRSRRKKDQRNRKPALYTINTNTVQYESTYVQSLPGASFPIPIHPFTMPKKRKKGSTLAESQVPVLFHQEEEENR